MISWLTLMVFGLTALVAGFALWGVLRNRQVDAVVLACLALELGLVIQAVVAVGLAVSGRHPREGLVFFSYLITILFVTPIGVFWANAEKSRWGLAVYLLLSAVVAVLEFRLDALWQPL